MRKVFIFAVCAGIIFLAVIISVSGNKNRDIDEQNVILAKNHIFLEDLVLSRLLNKEGGYTMLKAKTAYMDRNTDTILLQDTDIEMNDNNTYFTSRADYGQFILDKSLITKGKISGIWNSMTYKMDDNGTFEYDFTAKTGIFKDNITISQKGSYIKAHEMTFDSDAQVLDFSDGVEMYYSGETIK